MLTTAAGQSFEGKQVKFLSSRGFFRNNWSISSCLFDLVRPVVSSRQGMEKYYKYSIIQPIYIVCFRSSHLTAHEAFCCQVCSKMPELGKSFCTSARQLVDLVSCNKHNCPKCTWDCGTVLSITATPVEKVTTLGMRCDVHRSLVIHAATRCGLLHFSLIATFA